MEQKLKNLDLAMKRWFTLGYDALERCLMLASPFILGIGGAVSSLLHLPGAIDLMLFIACLDFMFLSIRSTVHIIVSIENKRFVRAVLFALIAIPTIAFVMYMTAIGSADEKLPFNDLQLVWFHLGMVSAAIVYTICLFHWYLSGHALVARRNPTMSIFDSLNSLKPVCEKGLHHSTGRAMDAAILAHVQDRCDAAPGREQFHCPFALCRDCGHHFGTLVWEQGPRTECGLCGSTKLINVTLSWNR